MRVTGALAPFLAGGSAVPTVRVLPYAAGLDALASGGVSRLEAGMPDAWIDDLAIAGTPAQCAASIAKLHAAGADAVALVPPPAVDADAWLDRVANQLLPLLRP
jgi:alkanesulfonate monooxygenase SsuD/methylene tetrahydromethanopterin reductase-like flavin-dependent oxidoreductase (luciferase family)